MERGDEQPALLAVFLAGEREQRAGTEYPPEVAVEVVGDIGPARNSCLTSAGLLMTTTRPKTGTLMVNASPNRPRSRRIQRCGTASA